MRYLTTLLVSALAIGPLAGCGESTSPQAGTLSILLTDAPGDVKKAVVTIEQVYLQLAEDENEQAAGRVVLRDEEVTLDLLTLANATTELVRDAPVPAGVYEQLRFVISGGYIEVENDDGSASVYASSPDYQGLPAGTQVDGVLEMPSFAETGIKVNLPGGELQITGEQTLLVDFDVRQSFGQRAGFSGMWVMEPVITATELSAGGV